jgi:hypothetical protein
MTRSLRTLRRLQAFFFLLAVCGIVVCVPARYASCENNSLPWEVKKTTHFILYANPSVPHEYRDKTLQYAERYYREILDNLGFTRFDFWTWDNRANIYLYLSQEVYVRSTGRPEWSGGSVDVKKRTISTFMEEKNFFETILPHELTHIILRDYIGMKARIPLWLEEGIACSQEKNTFTQRLMVAKNASRTALFFQLKDLNKINREEGLAIPGLFYAEGTSIVAFLLFEFGNEKFSDFCKKIKDSIPWDTALVGTYRFKNMDDFEKKWREFLLKDDSDYH